MWQTICSRFIVCGAWVALFVVLPVCSTSYAGNRVKKRQGPPPAPVRVATVTKGAVSEQITLVGNTEPVVRSTIAAEVEGLVGAFPVREGDFVKKRAVLAKLRATDLELRLRAAIAARKKVRASLVFAEKELARYTKLEKAGSVEARKYDEALYQHQALKQELLRNDAEIERLEDDIKKKTIVAPFAGFVAKEHTQVGQWLPVGGAVVTLLDLKRIRVTVDVPERHAVQLRPKDRVLVLVKSLSNKPFGGEISAVLPEGDPNARTFQVRVRLDNPGLRIRSGMEARVTFGLAAKKSALLVPKDAVVAAGANRLVFAVANGAARPVSVRITGYYDGNVSVEGPLKAGDQVVIRGNERLRPGQPVKVLK
ncbi:MAG: efflux RND transporter periplasmic adaptor subunit [Desulfobacterales bacterium]|nr:efflux RND transporter periplasmic adaptor subunit [Desulfobacterales bacterium]